MFSTVGISSRNSGTSAFRCLWSKRSMTASATARSNAGRSISKPLPSGAAARVTWQTTFWQWPRGGGGGGGGGSGGVGAARGGGGGGGGVVGGGAGSWGCGSGGIVEEKRSCAGKADQGGLKAGRGGVGGAAESAPQAGPLNGE